MPWTTSILYLLEWKPLLVCMWISLELISLLLFMISRLSVCSWTAFELSEFISPISVLDLQPQKEVLASSLIASHCSFPCCGGLPDSSLAIASSTVNRRIHNAVAMVFSMRHTVGYPWFVHVQLRTKRHALSSLSKLSSVSTTRLATSTPLHQAWIEPLCSRLYSIAGPFHCPKSGIFVFGRSRNIVFRELHIMR